MVDVTREYLIIIEFTVALGLILAKSFIHCKLSYWQAFVSSDMYFLPPVRSIHSNLMQTMVRDGIITSYLPSTSEVSPCF